MRIVIVEDEIKIREGMGKMIESQTGHMVVGEAADGEEGLEMVLRFKPDLVITDIRMPRMSGLQMLKELAERKVRTHIVILSGYSDFEYAQKAIWYGADDYLLKPLAIEDVRKMLKDIEAKIQEEDAFGYGNQENRLRDIFFGNVEASEEQIEELRRVCGFAPGMKYDLMAGYIGAAQPGYKEQVEKEIAELGRMYKDYKIYLMYQENRQIFFCLTVGKAEGEEEKSWYERAFYNQVVGKYQKKEERFVWAVTGCTEYNLREAKEHLERNLSYAMVLESEGWITDETVENYKAELFEYPLELGNHLKNAICRGESEEIIQAGEAFADYMNSRHYTPGDMRFGFLKTYHIVEDTLQDIDLTLHEYLKNSGIINRMENVFTYREMSETWEDVIKIIAGKRVKRENISNYIIQRAINYIREHYQEGITQEEVSRKLDITPEYLSALFSRELGIGFSRFLRRFRISHAKRLLKGTDMKIYEIAEAVGYSDAKYFARIFKEEQGVTPGEYRQLN